MKNKEELEKKTGVKCISSIDGIKCISSIDGIKKFDICLMNPPYNSGGERGGEYSIESDFVNNLNKITNKIIAIYPFPRWKKREKLSKENSTGGHLVSLDLYEGSKFFDICSQYWKYTAIWYYDNTKHYDNTIVKLNDKEWNVESYNNLENIQNAYNEINNEYIELKPLVDTRNNLYNKLLKDNKTMVNGNQGFIYQENRFKSAAKYGYVQKKVAQHKLERVKAYLKEGEYKFCLYKGSFNHDYDEVQEWKGQDPDKLFKGQICWLTNKENVKNNLKYWMECPLFDLWRKYKFGRGGGAADGRYGFLPALDFEMNENDFKEYVDSLNYFTEEEIKILKENNIHNADKLKPKK